MEVSRSNQDRILGYR